MKSATQSSSELEFDQNACSVKHSIFAWELNALTLSHMCTTNFMCKITYSTVMIVWSFPSLPMLVEDDVTPVVLI
jgi:hypothetical protein